MTSTMSPPAAASPAAAPRRSSRVLGIDLARGLAVIGMMAVHIIDASNEDGSPNLVGTLAAGRSATAFALIAGISLAFLSGRSIPPTGRARWAAAAGIAVRGVLIGLIGLTLAYLGAAQVILSSYGLMFLLVIPLLGVRPRVLAWIAAGIGVLGPILLVVLAQRGLDFPDEPLDPTLTTLLHDPVHLFTLLLLTGTYPAAVYLAYLTAGLAIGRLNLGAKATAVRLFAGGLILAVAARIASWVALFRFGGLEVLIANEQATQAAEAAQEDAEDAADDAAGAGATPGATSGADDEDDEEDDDEDDPGDRAATGADDAGADDDEPDVDDHDTIAQDLLSDTTQTDSWWYLALPAAHSHSIGDVGYTLGTAIAVLGLCLLLARIRPVARLLGPLAAIGSMPLTIYASHLVLLSSGVLQDQPVLLFWVNLAAAAVFAVVWRRLLGQGPMERLLASAAGSVRRAVAGRGRAQPAQRP